jgi:hypothetical protein
MGREDPAIMCDILPGNATICGDFEFQGRLGDQTVPQPIWASPAGPGPPGASWSLSGILGNGVFRNLAWQQAGRIGTARRRWGKRGHTHADRAHACHTDNNPPGKWSSFALHDPWTTRTNDCDGFRKFLLSTFAGNKDGLKVVLPLMALVVRGIPLPDKFFFLVGDGGDGKPLFLMTLLKAMFGTGDAMLPATILQVEDEMSKQGRFFRSGLPHRDCRPLCPQTRASSITGELAHTFATTTLVGLTIESEVTCANKNFLLRISMDYPRKGENGKMRMFRLVKGKGTTPGESPTTFARRRSPAAAPRNITIRQLRLTV